MGVLGHGNCIFSGDKSFTELGKAFCCLLHRHQPVFLVVGSALEVADIALEVGDTVLGLFSGLFQPIQFLISMSHCAFNKLNVIFQFILA